MQMNAEELREIVIKSYKLTVLMPKPSKKEGKYAIESRSKFKSLPEALRQMEDASASITHFVKSAAYFLPRKDAGTRPDQMLPFMDRLLEYVNELNGSGVDAEKVREKLQYLIGYANWNADAICAVLTANGGDKAKSEGTIRNMLEAELKVVGAGDEVEKVFELVKGWLPYAGDVHAGAEGRDRVQWGQARTGQQQRRRY